jgi:hypothetical protein
LKAIISFSTGSLISCRILPQKPGVALVLRSTGQGTGKGTFGTILRDIIGVTHSVQLLDTNQAMGDFNSIIENKLLVILDEAVFAGDKKIGKKLMGVISEPTITIRRLWTEAYEADNPIRVIIFTNEQQAIHAHIDDRRFYALNVSEAMKDNIGYFTALRQCMGNGGKESLYNHLLNRRYDKNNLLTRVHRNDDMISQIRQSFDSFDTWLTSVIERQSVYADGNSKRLSISTPTKITMHSLYNDYASTNRDRYPLNFTSFEERILNMSPPILKAGKVEYCEVGGRFAVMYELASINQIIETHNIHAPKGFRKIDSSETLGRK